MISLTPILFPQRKPSEISSSLAPGGLQLRPFAGGETDFPNAAPPLRVTPSRGDLSYRRAPIFAMENVGEEWDIHGSWDDNLGY